MRRALSIVGLLLLSVCACWGACSVTTASLPGGTIGLGYSSGLTSSGCGTAISLTWSITSGSLPSGLSIHSHVDPMGDGNISGTPALPAGFYPFTVHVSGSLGSASQALSINIVTGAPSFVTAALPKATYGMPYSVTLQVSGGIPPYSFSLPAGSLPPPLTLSVGGVIGGGNPTASGYYYPTIQACDSQPACVQRTYFIGSFPQFDQYQGIKGSVPSWCTAQSYFQLGMDSTNRWEFCTPKTGSTVGNTFWMFDVQNAEIGWLTPKAYANYGCANQTTCLPWYTNVANRMQQWGWNTIGEYGSSHFYDGSISVQLPFIAMGTLGQHIIGNSCTGHSGTIKGIENGLSTSPTNLQSLLYCNGGVCPQSQPTAVDVFDPWYQSCSSDTVIGLNQYISGGTVADPYVVMISPGETDELPFMKAQGPYCGGGAGAPSPPCSYADSGFLTLIANYCYANGSTSAAATGCNTAPNNHPLWTKYAFGCGVSGIDFGWGSGSSYLQNKYGTIGALNAAWGTNYASFCPSGGGWGHNLGTTGGLLDEDGSYIATFGAHPDLWTNSQLRFNASTIKNDIETFLRAYAKQSEYWFVYYIRNGTTGVPADANHLITSMNYFGGSNQSALASGDCIQNASQAVLLGLKDAGVQVLVMCYEPLSAASPRTAVIQNAYSVTGLPIYPWVAMGAQSESFWTSSCPAQGENYTTQDLRGSSGYSTTITDLFNATQGGVHPVVGIAFWGATDDNGASNSCAQPPPACTYPGYPSLGIQCAQGGGYEAKNFGLISNNDNAYDGNSDTIAAGVDAQGIPTGGELGNYTNFLGPVTKANLGVIDFFFVPPSAQHTVVNNSTVNNATVH